MAPQQQRYRRGCLQAAVPSGWPRRRSAGVSALRAAPLSVAPRGCPRRKSEAECAPLSSVGARGTRQLSARRRQLSTAGCPLSRLARPLLVTVAWARRPALLPGSPSPS
ncbi:hypothetical protein T484DRAFT_1970712 [Baffinella frigidus]|nr:hypothetical protein T484DRAFT_1970712 [Cryptophyta sp. CCMP2293]